MTLQLHHFLSSQSDVKFTHLKIEENRLIYLCPSHSTTSTTTNSTISTKPHRQSKCLAVVCAYSNNWFICSLIAFPPCYNYIATIGRYFYILRISHRCITQIYFVA